MENPIIKSIVLLFVALSPLALKQIDIDTLLALYQDNRQAVDLLSLVPFLFFGLIALLGSRLNKTRILFTALLLGATYGLLFYALPLPFVENPDLPYFARLAAFSILLAIVFNFGLQEAGLFSLEGLGRFVTVLLVPFCLYLSSLDLPILYTIFTEQPLWAPDGWHLPHITWLGIICALMILIGRQNHSILHFQITLTMMLIPLFLALNEGAHADSGNPVARIFSLVCFSLIGLMMLYSIYRLYWQKVYIDELTHIPNRRAFDEMLPKLGRKYSIAMVDIDHFKKFNDTYGHAEGDNVLRLVAKHLSVESGYRAYRYGGEEFSIVYNSKDSKDVLLRLDLMRKKLADRAFYIRSPEADRKKTSKSDRGKKKTRSKKVQITVSIGVANRSAQLKNPEQVMKAADEALYLAKEKGRNCCVSGKISARPKKQPPKPADTTVRF